MLRLALIFLLSASEGGYNPTDDVGEVLREMEQEGNELP